MNVSFVHKTFSVALSFLVLFSTLSLIIETHFCGGTLVDVAVFTTTEKCAGDTTETNTDQIKNKACCKDEIAVIEGLELTTNSVEDLEQIKQQVLFVSSYAYTNWIQGLLDFVIPHKDNVPPKLVKDIHLLDETFLI